jgi:hypothetical protein
MRIIIAALFAVVLTLSGSAQEFMADAGAPASAFPNPDRPVADRACRQMARLFADEAWWQRALAGERLPNPLFRRPKCEGTVEDPATLHSTCAN